MLRWIPEADRQRVWRDEIEPNFHDRDAHPASALGNLPFHATLWRRRGKQLLVFDDFD